MLGLLIFIGLGAGALAWRLRAGPIALPFLSARIAEALSVEDGSLAVAVAATALAWDPAEGELELRVSDVRLEIDGRPRASFPVVGLHLSPLALLRGEIIPTRIDLERPELRLIVRPDGSIDLGTPVETAAPTPHVAAERTAVRPTPAPGSALSLPPAVAGLREVRIHGGNLSLVPPADAAPFELRGLDLDLERRGEEISLRFDTALLRETDRIVISGGGHYRLDRRGGELRLSFRDLAPQVLAELLAETTLRAEQSEPGVSLGLEALRLPVSGNIHIALAELLPQRVEVDLEGAAGTIVVPELPALDAERLRLAVVLDLNLRQLALIDLTLQLGGPVVQVEATIADLAGEAAFTGKATVANLPVAALGSYWPKDAAQDARSWITSNLEGGRVRYARIRLGGRLDDPHSGGLAVDTPSGWLAFEGLSVRFLRSMPPARRVAGQGAFSSTGWKLAVLDGEAGEIAVRQARVRIATPQRGPVQLAVRASVAGPLASTIALLEREPVQLSRTIGFQPQVESGRVAGRLDLEVPLAGPGGRRSVTAIARAREVTLARVLREASFRDGELRLRLAHDSLRLRGKGLLADAPIRFDGREPLGRTAITERRLDLSGRFDEAARTALGIDTRPVLEGPVELQGTWHQVGPESAHVDLSLGLEQASLNASAIAVKKPAGTTGQVTARLVLERERLARVESLVLETPAARVTGRAAFVPGAAEIGSLDLSTAIRRHQGEPVLLRLKARPEGARSQISLRCDDASVWLEAIAAATDWSGGRLRLDGHAKLALEEFHFDGRLDVKNVTLDHSPLVARIISLTSISGLKSALFGKPIRFEKMASGLILEKDFLTIRGGAASGSSLRILLDGTIDRRRATANLEGTLVPSYYGINEAAQHIPVLGHLLGGQDNALLTIDFSLTGPLADPKISVKPLRSAAPGFLRDIVRRLGR